MAETPQVDTQQQLPPPNIAGLATLFPQQPGATATLGAQPSAPPAGGLQDYANLAQQQVASLTSSPSAQEARTARGEAVKQTSEAGAIPLPKTSWLDTQGQPSQGGFLHSLGRALMAIGGATTPGRAIQAEQYGPGVARYKAEHASKMAEAQSQQKRAEGAEEDVKAQAGVAGRTIMGGSRVEATDVATKQKAVAERDRHAEQVTRLQQQAEALGIKKEAQQALEKYRVSYLQSFDKRTAANEDVAMAAVGARQDAAAASGINKYQELHPYLSLLGIGPEPTAPAGAKTEPGSQTTVKPKPTAKGKIRVKMADGVTGSIDPSDFDPKTMKKVP